MASSNISLICLDTVLALVVDEGIGDEVGAAEALTVGLAVGLATEVVAGVADGDGDELGLGVVVLDAESCVEEHAVAKSIVDKINVYIVVFLLYVFIVISFN
ncbi:hypothetical protein [Paenibacillus sp. Soil766]|uniref:hypothetical protein n=1 Tax=Paenibacillus sp. Soil766 TaxID=1736404 RepID=UPI001F29B950|nr:hypothetical protein [Paenibacillus sp. Soil766]